jgi:VanZ family protein
MPYGDKFGHFILYGTLSLLTDFAFNYKCLAVNNYRFPIGAIIVLLIAIIEEITQLFISNRTFDLTDIIADFAGVFIFIWVVNKLRTANYKTIAPSLN